MSKYKDLIDKLEKGGPGSGQRGHRTLASIAQQRIKDRVKRRADERAQREKDEKGNMYTPKEGYKHPKLFDKYEDKIPEGEDRKAAVTYINLLVRNGHADEGHRLYRKHIVGKTQKELEKSVKNEGSRGGIVVGHTESGDPIYQSQVRDKQDTELKPKEDGSKKEKKRIKGFLEPGDGWVPIKSYHVDDLTVHGEGVEETCAHCKKSIKNVVIMSDPRTGEEHMCGFDCADALSEGSAQERVAEESKDFKKQERELKTTVKESINSLRSLNKLFGASNLGEFRENLSKEANSVVEKLIKEGIIEDTHSKLSAVKPLRDIFTYAARLSKDDLGIFNTYKNVPQAIEIYKKKNLKKAEFPLDAQHGVAKDSAGTAMESSINRDSKWFKIIKDAMADYQPGELPREISLENDKILHLVKVEDGLYSGFVKEPFGEREGLNNPVKIETQTIPEIVTTLITREVIADDLLEDGAEKEHPREETDAKFSELLGKLKDQRLEVHGDLNIFMKSRKPFPIGTKRTWGKQEYTKHADGWVATGGKHHGKLMGKFKSDPTHSEFVSQSDRPSDEGSASKEKAETSPKTEAKKEIKPEIDSEEKKAAKQKLNNKPYVEFNEGGYAKVYWGDGSPTGTTMLPSSQEHMKALVDSEINKLQEDINSYKLSQKEWLVRYKEVYGFSNPRLRKWQKEAAFRKHRKSLETAFKAGVIDMDGLSEYKDLQVKLGASSEILLPPEINLDVQKRTNMLKSVDFSKATKSLQKELYEHLNDCNTLVDSMGIRFKTPINFDCASNLKKAKRVAGTHSSSSNTVTLKDMSDTSKTVMHEIGHAIDYAMQDQRAIPKGPQRSQGRSAELFDAKGDDSELNKAHKELYDLITNSDYYQKIGKEQGNKFYNYIKEPTEVFARGFEVYSRKKAEELVNEGKISKAFIESFVPSIYKTKSEEIGALKQKHAALHDEFYNIRRKRMEVDSVAYVQARDKINPEDYSSHEKYRDAIYSLKNELLENNKEFQKLTEVLNSVEAAKSELYESKLKGVSSFTEVLPEKRKEYEDKISKIMETILKNDEFRKSFYIKLLTDLLNKSKK